VEEGDFQKSLLIFLDSETIDGANEELFVPSSGERVGGGRGLFQV